jgi:hypothetical protein
MRCLDLFCEGYVLLKLLSVFLSKSSQLLFKRPNLFFLLQNLFSRFGQVC